MTEVTEFLFRVFKNSKINLEMQKLHPLTGQCKGYGTQVNGKACTHLVF